MSLSNISQKTNKKTQSYPTLLAPWMSTPWRMSFPIATSEQPTPAMGLEKQALTLLCSVLGVAVPTTRMSIFTSCWLGGKLSCGTVPRVMSWWIKSKGLFLVFQRMSSSGCQESFLSHSHLKLCSSALALACKSLPGYRFAFHSICVAQQRGLPTAQ